MEHLRDQLDKLLAQLPDEAGIRARLVDLVSVYPFNEYEFIISTLLAADVLDLESYQKLRDGFIARNEVLMLYGLGPTAFGTTWAQGHLREFVPALQKPSRKSDFDLLLDGNIRIEVKASRAVDKNSKKPLVEKALTSKSSKPFLMNFQQIKPRHFDVIICIGAWLDKIRYWLLSATEVGSHQRFSDKQHRGNVGEGQLHVKQDNVHEFNKYEVEPNKLEEEIRAAYVRELEAKG